jgi:phage gpG-like protein
LDALVIISITPFGEDRLSEEILRVGRNAADIEPALEGASDGSAWAPLNSSTTEYKAAHGLDPRILHATLSLRNSLTDPSDPGAVFEPTPEGAFMGSDVEYAIYHESAKPRRSNLPRRPVVALTEDEKVKWLEVLQRWIMTGTR